MSRHAHPDLHEPMSSEWDDVDDWRRCGTCGEDLMDLFACPDAPLADCGCPCYLVNNGEHYAGACAVFA